LQHLLPAPGNLLHSHFPRPESESVDTVMGEEDRTRRSPAVEEICADSVPDSGVDSPLVADDCRPLGYYVHILLSC
jgi:hypothetical protein